MIRKDITLETANAFCKGNMLEYLGIEFTEIGEDYVCAKMPVTSNVHQPYGILHGGASVTLAESVGSSASAFIVDTDKYNVMGIEINANHVRAKRDGWVFAKATPQHLGRTLHIWQINITDENDKLICTCRLTNIIQEKK